ncbi:MAG: ABC transporter ATP-binding protein [Candidatus Bipolaricaulota bacterium]|nr:ABC transporter ATP-binding protein [Candidatus Bipolaricaulota bacterium]
MKNDVPVKFFDISKRFGDTLAVDSADFSIHKGEFFGLLGPNGAGKTTLIKLLIGLANPTEGTAEVFGYDINEDYRQVHSYVGFAPAEANLDREFNIFDNLRFHAGYNGVSPREQLERAEQQLKKFDLWEKRNDKPYELSTGMRKKLLFARSMIIDPKIVILDEPTAGLDLETKEAVQNNIKKITEEGVTILFTTHQIDEAERLCDRVAIMNEGKVIEIGPPEELLESGQGDLVRITLAEEIDSLPGKLTRDGLRVELVSEKKEVRATVADGSEAAADIMRALHGAGIATKAVHVEKASLEDLFLQLTSKDDKTVSKENRVGGR